MMLSTGFTREVLLAQIGRTELIQENKRHVSPCARPLEEKNEGVDTGIAAEKTACLLAEGGVEPGTISAEDFISPKGKRWRETAGGLTPAAILEKSTMRTSGAEQPGCLRAKAAQASRN
ncbi:MAG: hypothetical protein ACLUI3_14765 [Christensenellales bacterium]